MGVENWDQPDDGIWETRGGRKQFAYSRLMCWVALERALRIAASAASLPTSPAGGRPRRDLSADHVRGWNERPRAFVQHYDTDVLDASLLLMPLCKFVSPDRPALALHARRDQQRARLRLARLPLQRRSLPRWPRGEEGTFSICTFWYVEALARAGRLDEARLVFEKMLTYANHLGLYAEQIGPTGEQLGNFPQAFTHLALISAAVNLDRQLG